MRAIICVFGLLALATLTFAGQVNSFTANFEVRRPGTGAYTVGQLSYSLSAWALRLDYTARNYSEIHIFNSRYGLDENATYDQWAFQTGSSCTGCKAATLNYSFPVYVLNTSVYQLGSPSPFNGCDHYVPINPAGTNVTDIWFNTATGYICKAVWVDLAEYIFNTVTPATFTADKFLAPPECRCKGPNKHGHTDIIILIDRSASIGKRDHDDARSTARDFCRQFDIKPSGVNVLIAQFDEDVDVHLQFFQGVSDGNIDAAINTLKCDCGQKSISPSGQGDFQETPSKDVCCGKRSSVSKALRRTWDTILKASRGDSDKIIFVITDGRFNTKSDGTPCSNANECDDDIKSELAQIELRYPGSKVYGIGVGNTDHRKMGTMCGGRFNRYINSSKWWKEHHHPIVGNVGCPITTTFCDPTTCCGMCQCGECLAPTGCDTTDKCNPASLNGGRCCTTAPLNCPDPGDCQYAECDSAIGCVNKTITCPVQTPENELCFPYNCLNDICFTSPQGIPGCPRDQCATNADCNDNNACTLDVCAGTLSQGTYCSNSFIQCDDHNACTIDSCIPSTGCKAVAIDVPTVCNDHVSCTTDICNPAAGCQNVVADCNDGKDCTTDVCNTTLGYCSNVDIKCPPLADNCTVSMCITGPDCVFDSSFCANALLADRRLTTGAIVGTVIGVTVGAALLAVAGFVAFKIIKSSKAEASGGSAGDFAAE